MNRIQFGIEQVIPHGQARHQQLEGVVSQLKEGLTREGLDEQDGIQARIFSYEEPREGNDEFCLSLETSEPGTAIIHGPQKSFGGQTPISDLIDYIKEMLPAIKTWQVQNEA